MKRVAGTGRQLLIAGGVNAMFQHASLAYAPSDVVRHVCFHAPLGLQYYMWELIISMDAGCIA